MNARVLCTAVLAVALAAATLPARAGTACVQSPLSLERFHKAETLALDLHRALDTSDASAVVIARVGSDLSTYGLRFSHAGLALRDGPDETWRVIHLLNHCGAATAGIYEEGLLNFFLDDPHEYAALVLVPGKHLQQRLLEVVRGAESLSLFQPAYNMLAHPRSQRFQNSNQWILEVIASAQSAPGSVTQRAAAQSWVAQHGYTADTIALPAFTRLGARLFSANIRLDDHPVADQAAGRFAVVTVRSLERYLANTEPALKLAVLEVTPGNAPAALGRGWRNAR